MYRKGVVDRRAYYPLLFTLRDVMGDEPVCCFGPTPFMSGHIM